MSEPERRGHPPGALPSKKLDLYLTVTLLAVAAGVAAANLHLLATPAPVRPPLGYLLVAIGGFALVYFLGVVREQLVRLTRLAEEAQGNDDGDVGSRKPSSG